jgi:alkylation response protein AidB-like acyl-CoA dehydrogenase
VSNSVRASFGVVFYRSGSGPLGVGAALVEAGAAGFSVAPIETVGVRGAQLGAITLDGVHVTAEQVLGRHLSPVRRGTWGWLRTLNRLRPTVAAMAVGLAQAAYDHVRESRRALTGAEQDRLDRMDRRIETVRQLTRVAAAAVDRDPDAGHLAFAAKQAAATLAARVTAQALDFFGPGARLEQPWLDKLARDAMGLEFMEGTGNIQRLSLFAALAKGALECYPPAT